MHKLPISAMVVGYNEAHFLEKCLQSISFCDEIFYTDLGSTDNSILVAQKFTTNILHRDKANVPSCEMVQTEVVHLLKNDWVIFIDPDEVVDATLAIQIGNQFAEFELNKQLGAILVPWQFYFKNHKLLGTVWGGSNKKYLMVNKHRFVFEPIIHYGRKLLPAFKSFEIEFDGNTNALHHYWMNSYTVFLKKHQRYLKNEGRDGFNSGRRTSLKKIFFTPFSEFYFSFISKQGYKDYFVGFILSMYWAYYKTVVNIGIYKIQKQYK